MRKKINYGLLILIGFVGVFLILHFAFGMFNYFYCPDEFDSTSDINKGDIHLISYGLPDFLLEDKIQKIAKSYGFYYQNRGCSVAESEIICTKNYNNKIIEHLSERNGKEWYKRFETSIDSLETIVYSQEAK